MYPVGWIYGDERADGEKKKPGYLSDAESGAGIRKIHGRRGGSEVAQVGI